MMHRTLSLLVAGMLAFTAMQTWPATAYADADVLTGNVKKDPASAGGGDGAASKKTENDVSGGRFKGDPIYVKMSPMIMPVISDNGVEQLVTIIFSVEVKDFDAADEMNSSMPRVMDALMRTLYGGLGSGALRDGKLVDVARVKTKATAAVGDVIGRDNVRDVLVQNISQRML